ncbi:hypothetical protein P3X46_015680 [Hevea brasiliensis]|uniref:RING-type domain-containing protein n=1 Tax=Hevea brasiliensis TaxID=3981 RepID=A0ABQ9LWP3_HEVBR|nr:uncharacterized protein LOC110640658 [Hevea brasiliensis]KAJ9172439.1 hypothetical protein P3X46_015680 [Hevea brasiliensis]KAJ9172440.1 hypothetical protein P3X46_015680 [Hevea brasiliensis]KAJ9172441.1 hypothetical protein P3X46_015680 [Hevea brasiliensis]
MGFDNECILNIQSLAGEYFCPVCRLLVYPNEALQSLCTHLYCKPCLTYIVSTTRACPYDGYLVTEADSKPLIESNKALAETIGKITVHCLYHRSGCTWQGPLSECTSHCSGCAFGNSPVVCNRCGIQIVHRQVQEHAQNCPGVQSQAQSDAAQDATATGTTPVSTQVAAQAGTTTTQDQTSQTTATPLPVQDPNQQANQTSQPQSVVQATVPTAEQWYQQQQQYQQYYQQYPGYDPYQQHYQQYYPYQQQAVPQYPQPQVYLQPQFPQQQVQPQTQLQTQSLSNPHVQAPAAAAAQPQNQPQVNLQQQTHTVQPQSQIQSQINPPPHGQPQSQAQQHPQTHPVQHHLQHVQMPQNPRPHSQIQHPQPQVQALAHSQLHPQYPVPQPRNHSQGLPQTHAQHPSQPVPQAFTSQPNQPLNPHLQPQLQHSSAHAVTGHNSYTQPQSQQQMQLGGLQHPAHLYPQGGPQPQSHLVQMQSQFPQQPPLLRPPQSHGPIQNPQQPGLLPSPGQVPNVPPVQQQPVHSHAQQPGLPHQHLVMQSVQQQVHQQYVQQQPFSGQAPVPVQNQVPQQGAYTQQQLHVHSQIRPQGLPPSFQQPSNAYPLPQQHFALLHGTQSHQAQTLGGRPMVPPLGVPTQPHPHSSALMQVKPMEVGAGQSGIALRTNNQDQSPSELQSGPISRPMSEKQGDHTIEKSSEAESTHKNVKRDPDDLDVASGVVADVGAVKTVKSECYLKPVDADNKPMGNVKDISESHGAENGEYLIKQVKKEPREASNDQKDGSNTDHKRVEHSVVSEDKEMKSGPLLKTPPLQEGEHLEDHSMKSQDLNMTPQCSGGFTLHGQVQGEGLVQPSHLVPIAEQGKQQPPLIPHGPSVLQQRPVGSPLLQAPPPGPPHHMQLPGHPSAPSRSLGSGHMSHTGQPLNPLHEHLQQPLYKQSHGPEVSPIGIAGLGSTSIFGRGPSHYGPQGPSTQGHGLPLEGERTSLYGHESDMFPNQRPNYTDGRRLDPFGKQSGMHTNAMRLNGAPGPDSLGSGSRDDRFRPLLDEHMNPFPQDPGRIVDQAEFEEDAKHFPRPSHLDTESVQKYGSQFPPSRPLDRVPHNFGMNLPLKTLDQGPHGMNYDSGMKLEPLGGSAPPKFFPNHHDGLMHPNDIGERPVLFLDKTAGRQPDTAQTQPDLFGPVPRYGRRHMDGLATRSPGRDYPGVSSHGVGAFPGLDDIAGRESRRFGDSFHNNRFPALPSHLRRGQFEGPGQDGFPNHLRRGEHMLMGEPFGFGAFPGPARMGELPGPGNFFHSRLGEPGFRSGFSHKGIPGDGGNYPGDLESFDGSRRRKASSMGWCRICKVDCESVEGLDIHSQTRDHQKMAMDMVVTIKQNAKKQKLASSDHSSLDNASKSRNASFEGRGNKN